MTSRLPRLEPDELITPEVGAWGERKYRLVAAYSSMFASSMKEKWDCRAYIDLFAGSGRAMIEGTSKIVLGSPLLALSQEVKFDKYVFCERDEENMAALKIRSRRMEPDIDPDFIEMDANVATERILSVLPAPRPGFSVLCFCFADPYKLGNLRFETLRKLATRYMDFLVLIPSYMDAHRNSRNYVRERSKTVERYLGNPGWRSEWAAAERNGQDFGAFIAVSLGRQMVKLGFSLANMVQVRSIIENIPLYHLAFFSRHPLGAKFWREARKYSQDQMDLPFSEA